MSLDSSLVKLVCCPSFSVPAFIFTLFGLSPPAHHPPYVITSTPVFHFLSTLHPHPLFTNQSINRNLDLNLLIHNRCDYVTQNERKGFQCCPTAECKSRSYLGPSPLSPAAFSNFLELAKITFQSSTNLISCKQQVCCTDLITILRGACGFLTFLCMLLFLSVPPSFKFVQLCQDLCFIVKCRKKY